MVMFLCVHVGPAEPVVDGSGAITGLAYYQLRIDKNLVDKKCESLEYKLDRLKAEYTLAKERHDKEKLVRIYTTILLDIHFWYLVARHACIGHLL